jgi:hypothetical protein
MSDESAILGDGKAAEQAASWFARLQGGAATGEDWLAFERWLQASPAHADAYESLERLWVDLDNAAIIRDLGVRPPRLAPRAANGNRRAWIGAGAALAASFAVVAIGVGLWPGPNLGTGAPQAQTYRTAPGQTRDITLADGTQIRLNAASQITVRLGKDARRVEMADAEATFDVTHDATRPFLIAVGDRQVRVVGTEFNLRHREGKVALTVRRRPGLGAHPRHGRPAARPRRRPAPADPDRRRAGGRLRLDQRPADLPRPAALRSGRRPVAPLRHPGARRRSADRGPALHRRAGDRPRSRRPAPPGSLRARQGRADRVDGGSAP